MSTRWFVLFIMLAGCKDFPAPPADAPCDDRLRYEVSECRNRIDDQGCRMVAWAAFQTCTLERSGVLIGPPPAEAHPVIIHQTTMAPR